MSPADPSRHSVPPFRISARTTLRRGWSELWRAPLPTLLALAGTLAGLLAVRAAWVRAGELLAAAAPATAVATLLIGLSSGVLLLEATRATALSAYASPPRSLPRLLRLGLERTPAMITVRAVEVTIYLCLGLGDLFALTLIHSGTAARSALLALLLLAPSLVLAAWLFLAARVAQSLVARGLPPAPALAHGFDVALRRFPSLARLALAGVGATAPFWIVALLMPWGLRQVLLALAALWLYAALIVLVGRDARLVTG